MSRNLELESPIVQICVAGPKLVVSCETKTVVCDTEAKTFRDATLRIFDINFSSPSSGSFLFDWFLLVLFTRPVYLAHALLRVSRKIITKYSFT